MVNVKKWDVFWRLTAVGESEKRWKWRYEKCVCECWAEKYVLREHLRHWKTRSCWCLARELSSKRLEKSRYKHGMYNTPLYKKYRWAKYRCDCPNAKWYAIYGGRWIKFLWGTFEEFYEDMHESYEKHVDEFWAENTTLDRINPNWNYCKENCRWATWQEQNDNRRSNTKIIYRDNVYPSISALSKSFGLPPYLVRERLRYWWSINDAIERPIQTRLHK